MKFFRQYIFFLVLLVPQGSMAWHIIGGEMYYTCLGSNNYRITLKIYRDCSNPIAAPFDDPAFITVYNATGLPVQPLSVFFPGAITVQPDLSNPCLQVPPGICVEQGVYEVILNLPPSSGGYDISYQRCCRNSTIGNIIDPSNTGATYTAHIPDQSLASCNSSPRYSNYPPLVICAGTPLVFDHSATDPDGDILVYSLCTPNQGASASSPQPNPAPPPPYYPIYWAPPYGVNNQLGGNPPMTIDANTGILTANPVNLGQYVVGICVKEYRDGALLSQNVRDFQFNVTTCDPLIVADFNSSTAIMKSDTLLLCGSLSLNFDNLSYGSNDFAWDFGVIGITSDVSSLTHPSYTFPDTGVYKVRLIAGPGLQCGDTSYKYVELRNGVTADFSFQDQCVGTPYQFNDQSIPLDGTLSSWQWTFGDGSGSSQQNPAHPYSSSGTFNVTLVAYNSYGCFQSVSKQTVVHPVPQANAAPDTFICDIDAVTLHANNGVNYSWQPDYNISNTSIPDPVATPDVTTVYTVTVTDANGCKNIDSVVVQVTDTVIASVSPDTTICEGEFVQLKAEGAVYYIWYPDAGLNHSDISSPVASPSSSILYLVDSYIGSCVDHDSVSITVLPKPLADAGPDVTINQGEIAQFNASGGENYSWQPPDALNNPEIFNPVANPLNSITYTVTVTGANGCKSIDSIIVTVTHIHEIFAPNAFTPNGDGINDVFQFFTKGISHISSVKVFNRWGEMIFRSNTNETGWDGTYKGIDCEMETYVYLIDGITYDGDPIMKKGVLTLIR